MLGRWLSALMLVVLSLAAVSDTAPAKRTPSGTRAMWVWSRADPAAIVGWATTHGVTEIFAGVDADIATNGDLPRLQQLKSRADAAGIRLTALGGDPAWVFDHNAALTWQRNVLGTGLFAGSHVDVEPYGLSEWNTRRDTTVAAYSTLLEELEADDVRPVEADVGFWYSTITAFGGNLADAVLARVSAVTVMSYRDTGTGRNSMTDVGRDMLSRGIAVDKPVRLAAETQQLPDCPYCTFYEKGRAKMTNELAKVDTEAGKYSSFAGIAVHHYDSWLMPQP